MQITIRALGSDKVAVLPEFLLAQVGLHTELTANASIHGDAIVLRKKTTPPVRQGWREAALTIAQAGDDALLLGEFANADDQELDW